MHPTYGTLSIDDSACFLCGCNSPSITQEHVFPKWLQNQCALWNEHITLLNGTTIPYNKLTIPCCSECNSKWLSKLENKIRYAVKNGYQRSAQTEDLTWYLWAGKILYGILRKELILLVDRSNPEKGTIIEDKTLKSFSNLHMFLQAIRGKIRFNEPVPYTVLICNIHDLGPGKNYFFIDDLLNLTISIRIGEVGVIVSFQDAGLINETYAKYVSKVDGRKLHPIQFDELYAKVSYQISLQTSVPSFITSSHVEGITPASVRMLPFNNFVRPWSQEEFAHRLLFLVSKWLKKVNSIEDIFVPPDQIYTWMVSAEDQLLLLKLEDWKKTLAP